ncbi:MATE family efflux transporter [Salinarchaeum sp. Harcht-Bsk1]|uniref:MATE family efflux transporter n=1 Tax=Salinarchaeum sp. Harcht-Bsk1 TaxID=1333523 RepID=UPI00373AF2BE
MDRGRVASVWRRVLSLSWPMMVEQVTRTGMRTTDVFVTALFSPIAVAAIGLADLYARLPLRIGLGLGTGAIALSSQDTGAGAEATRDEAISQALLVGALAGIPFVLFGFFLGEPAIAVLGEWADPDEVAEVADLGGTYLAIIFATAPARHVSLIAARSLQGTGDTRTPMYVNVVSNVLNVALSLILGLGLLGAPRLEVVGVGLATAFGNVFTATVMVGVLALGVRDAGLRRPTEFVIAKQLLVVSAPKIAEGLIATVIEFPFNALLLYFGTPVNAGYQIGRRVYQQVTSPLSRGLHVAASVVVGQSLGAGKPDEARFDGWATTALGVLLVGSIGLGLVVAAGPIVGLFTDDAATASHALAFVRAYGLSAPFLAAFVLLAGALQGASETRTPFIARTSGLLVVYLGVSFVGGLVLGYGPLAVYVAVAAWNVWGFAIVCWGFARGDWAERAASMMADRGSTAGDAVVADGESDENGNDEMDAPADRGGDETVDAG